MCPTNHWPNRKAFVKSCNSFKTGHWSLLQEGQNREGQRSKMVDTWGESIKTHFIPSTGVALTSQQTSVTCVSVIREEHGVSVLKRGGQCAFKTLMFGRRNQWFLMCSVLLIGHRSTPTSPALFLPLSCFMFQCSLPAKTKSWRIS